MVVVEEELVPTKMLYNQRVCDNVALPSSPIMQIYTHDLESNIRAS